MSSPCPSLRPSRILGTRYGAFDIDSIPPATTSLASPALIDCAANITAFSPDPQTLLTVMAGIVAGSPPWIAAWRAGGEVALGPLLALLPDDAPARRALGASVAKAPGLGEPEAFVRLAERLPAPSGSALLADAVVSADAAPSAPRLLRALASSGGAAEAPRPLAWLAARPGDPPLRALAWTVCARLDEAATLARWSASGRPADVLRDAARDVAWRRDADALDRVRAALHPPAPVARGGLGPGAVVVRRPAPEPRSQRPPEVP